MDETPRDRVSNLEDHAMLEQFEDVLKEVLGLPTKRDINFSINLMLGAAPVSKNPYIMSTLELKELQMHLEEILEEGVYTTKCVTLGCPSLVCEEKRSNIKITH
jgi:hypothetical protein